MEKTDNNRPETAKVPNGKNGAVRRRKRVCPHCGRRLWMREFRPLKNGHRNSWCHDCVLAYSRERYRKNGKVADGVFMHRTLGRVVEHNGCSTRIHWNGNMLSLMRRHYPDTLNREMAGMLGVSERTVTRKAREMGLRKSPEFLLAVSRDHLLLANARSRELGYPGRFTKGMKFRGNQYTGRTRTGQPVIL